MEGRIEKLITSHKKWKTERYERATSKSSPIVRVMHKIAVSILTGFTNYCLTKEIPKSILSTAIKMIQSSGSVL